MKPFFPKIEANLKRLAAKTLGHSLPADHFSPGAILIRWLAWPMAGAGFALFVSYWTQSSPAWSQLAILPASTIFALIVYLALKSLVWQGEENSIWLRLPTPGEWLAARARRRHLHAMCGLLSFCLVGAWVAQDAAANHHWTAHATALFLVNGATPYLLAAPSVQRFRLPQLWLLTGLLIAVLAGVHRAADHFGWPFADELLTLANGFAMLFPSWWARPAPYWNLWELVTGIWVCAGAWAWWTFPRRIGRVLDGPEALAHLGECYVEGDGEDEFDEIVAKASPSVSWADPQVSEIPGEFPLREALWPEKGWIENLAVRLLGTELQPLAALCCPNPGWTSQWKLSWIGLAAALLILWLGRFLPPDGKWSAIATFVGGLTLAVSLAVNFPLGNQFYRLLIQGVSERAPVLAVLPVTVEQVLAVSQRITLARCVSFITLPSALLAGLVLFQGLPLLLLAAPFVLCLVLIAARPAMAAFRLLWVARPSRRFRCVGLLLLCMTCALSLLSGLCGAIASLLFVIALSPANAWHFLGCALFAILLIYALAKTAVGLLCLGRKTGRIDWRNGLG